MSILTLILGESGTGKSASMRNLDPKKTLLIQTISKPLPFPSKEWQPISKDAPENSIMVSDQSNIICSAMKRAHEIGKEIIVIDDFQYLMANEFMRRSAERGYDKFSEIARHAWDILDTAHRLPNGINVYILSHTQESETGATRIKTIGKMLDDKITIEGMASIVLRSQRINGNYLFSTQNNGKDTTKSPLGMFDDELIDNDLNAVNTAINNYYF